MRRWKMLLAVAMLATVTCANAAAPTKTEAHGAPDRDIPGWTISSAVPTGWTGDCCLYAKAIGVDYVVYKGDWSGDPDRVMVLNVWPRKLATLDDEWQADRKQYLQRDPAAKNTTFVIDNPVGMQCHGLLYEGTDHVDDVVVFCDPGPNTGIRLSWSVTIKANDPLRTETLSLFKQVVQQSAYSHYVPAARSTTTKTGH